MGKAHEVQSMSPVVCYLDERGRVVGLDNRACCSDRPPAGLSEKSDDLVLGMMARHQPIVAATHGMSTHRDTSRGGRSRSTSQIVDDYDEDFLDEIIRESTERSPEFPALLEQARRNREATTRPPGVHRRSGVGC